HRAPGPKLHRAYRIVVAVAAYFPLEADGMQCGVAPQFPRRRGAIRPCGQADRRQDGQEDRHRAPLADAGGRAFADENVVGVHVQEITPKTATPEAERSATARKSLSRPPRRGRSDRGSAFASTIPL